MEKAQVKQKLWYNRTARETQLSEGDKVLLMLPTPGNKLMARWQGPFVVTRKVGSVNYELNMPSRRKKKAIFHVNLLKRWHEPESLLVVEDEADAGRDHNLDLAEWRTENSTSELKTGINLSRDQEKELRILIQEFPTVMADTPGKTYLTKHRILRKTNETLRQRPYRIPSAYEEAVKKEIKEMLDTQIIEPSSSDWASPMVIVPKKDGGIRICIDS